MITGDLPYRGSDAFGEGHFGASRGSRTHKGIDFACYPDTKILSPVDGIVSRHGYPYADDLTFRYIEITNIDTKYKHRMFYVFPDVSLGVMVKKGDYVGYSQDIAGKYSTQDRRMKNHVHYEIKYQSVYLDPNRVHYEES